MSVARIEVDWRIEREYMFSVASDYKLVLCGKAVMILTDKKWTHEILIYNFRIPKAGTAIAFMAQQDRRATSVA